MVGFHTNTIDRQRKSPGYIISCETIGRKQFQAHSRSGTRWKIESNNEWKIRNPRTSEMGHTVKLHVNKL